MNPETVITILLCIQVFTFVMLAIQNHSVLRSSDKRLAMANEMVLKLASSAATLADSLKQLKDLMSDMDRNYTKQIDLLMQRNEDFKDSYIKLLHRYEEKEQKIESMHEAALHTINSLATRGTYNNNIYESSQQEP